MVNHTYRTKPPYGDGVNIINTSSQLAWTGVWPKFNQVNHNPVAILNGDRSKQIVKITTKSRDNIKLTAVGSSDPDDNKISSSWMIYREVSTSSNGVKLTQLHSLETILTLPQFVGGSSKNRTIHVILTIEDNGTPSLTAYRRAIITVQP